MAGGGRAEQKFRADGGRAVQRHGGRLLHLSLRRQGVPVVREREAGGDVEGRVRHRRLLPVQEGQEQHDDGSQQEDFDRAPRRPQLAAGGFRQVLARRVRPVAGEGGEELSQGAAHAVREQEFHQSAAEEAVQELELIGQLVGVSRVRNCKLF